MYDSFNIHGFFLTTGKGVIFLALNIETNGVVNTCKTLVRCKEFSDNMAGLHQGRWQSFYPDQGEGWVVSFWKYIYSYLLLEHLSSFLHKSNCPILQNRKRLQFYLNEQFLWPLYIWVCPMQKYWYSLYNTQSS